MKNYQSYLIGIIILTCVVFLLYKLRREREVQIKNVILYKIKPISYKDDNSVANVFDKDNNTSWKPSSQEDKTYILGFEFNKEKEVSKVKVLSSKTPSYNSINQMKIRMPNGELVYDTAKSIPLVSSTNISDKKEPQILDIVLEPPVKCTHLLLEFICDTINETACDVREIMFYEKQKHFF